MEIINKIIDTAAAIALHTKEITGKETTECLGEAFEKACIMHDITSKELIELEMSRS